MDTTCDSCGKAIGPDGAHLWHEEQVYRVLIDPAARDAPLGPGEHLSDDGLYRIGARVHARQVCAACLHDLQGGATFGALHQRRIGLTVALFVGIGIVLLVAMPFLMPYILSALWRSPGEH